MYLWTKIKYYTGIYGTSIYEGKNMVDYKKLLHFDLKWKNKPKGLYTKTIEFFKQIHNIWTLVYYVKTMVLWKKL